MIHRLKEKIQLKNMIKLIPTILFLIFIICMAIPTLLDETVQASIKEANISFSSISDFTDNFEKTLQENFYEKNNYINLNGLTTRVLGINSLNERQKMENGQLADYDSTTDISLVTENVIELNDFLRNRDIEFLYLLVPHKTAFYDAKFSPGYENNNTRIKTDSIISTLTEADVNNIDMNAWFEANNWTMDDVYYKTDLHWKPQAGMAAADLTMSLLAEQNLVEYEEESLSINNYTVTTLKNWFLGGHGKRTGSLYVGVDDFDVITPNFATNYTYSEIDEKTNTWQYYTTLLDENLISRKDYFGLNPYATYMHGNCPLQKVVNTNATNKKKVLITGDSFKLPYEYFMTTQFEEVYTIDLRAYTDGTFAQYVKEIQPDIVIMCIHSYIDEREYDFGVSEYETSLKETVPDQSNTIELGDISFTTQENSNNDFKSISADLIPGKSYTLTVDNTSYSGDNEMYIQVDLQDLTNNTKIFSRYFDANSNDMQKWIFTVPESENATDSYAFYLYAGTKEPPTNNSLDITDTNEDVISVKISDIKLREGIFED